MAEVNHQVVQNSNTFTTTTASYQDVAPATGDAISLTPAAGSTKYLVIAFAEVAVNSTSDDGFIRISGDSTIEAKSAHQQEMSGATRWEPYFFVHSFTSPATPVAIKMQAYAGGASQVSVDQAILVLIDLDDLGSSNYYEDINADSGTDFNAGPTESPPYTMATIAGSNLGTTDPWLVLGYARWNIGATNSNTEFALKGANDASTQSTLNRHSAEGEAPAEERIVGFIGRHKAVTSNVDLDIEVTEESNNTNGQDGGSYLIAIKGDSGVWADVLKFWYDANTEGVTSAEETLGSITNYTPTTGGNHLIFSRINRNSTGTIGGNKLWVDDGTTQIRTGDEANQQSHLYDQDDLPAGIKMNYYSISSQTTLNLQVVGPSSTSHDIEHQWLLALNLNLAAADQTVNIGIATETDSARTITPVKPIIKSVGIATETDTALTITPVTEQVVLIGQAIETDTALSITPVKPITQSVGIAAETDAALTIAPYKPIIQSIGIAAETDTALVVTPYKPVIQAIGIATETDTALAITGISVRVPGNFAITDFAAMYDGEHLPASGDITEWNDATANNRDLDEDASGSGPPSVVTRGGFRGALFDLTSGEALEYDEGSEFYTGDIGIITVFEFDSLSTVDDRVVFSAATGGSGSTWKHILGNTYANSQHNFVLMSGDGSGSAHKLFGEPVTGKLYVVGEYIRDSGDDDAWVNGIQELDGENSGGNNLRGWRLGSRESDDRYHDGVIYYHAIIEMDGFTETNFTDALDDVMEWFGIIPIGQATETDAALTITPIKAQIVAIDQATETDIALTITPYKPITVSVNQATEIDAALTIALVKPITVSISQATETDTALTITPVKAQIVAIGLAAETDSALTVTPYKPQFVAIGIAAETDVALTITPVKPITVTVGIATETDTALAITPLVAQVIVVGVAAETDSARTITPYKPQYVAVGIATEIDSARVITPVISGQIVAIGQATETDTALTITPYKPVVGSISQATETDTALPITPVKPQLQTINQAAETDTALVISPVKPITVTINQAAETDTAFTITPISGIAIGQAVETDTALSITPVKPVTVSIGQATETSSALSITPLRTVDIGQATETDTALSISVAHTVQLGVATETDTALSIAAVKPATVSIGQAEETDTALSINPTTLAIILPVGIATETDVALSISPFVPAAPTEGLRDYGTGVRDYGEAARTYNDGVRSYE